MQQYPPPDYRPQIQPTSPQPQPPQINKKRFDYNQAILIAIIVVLFAALVLSALPEGQFIRDFLRGALHQLGMRTAY